MKHILNNLYIFSNNKYLHKEHETIEVMERNEDGSSKIIAYFPVHTLSGIYFFNTSLISSWLVVFCSENCINLSYFSEQGRFLGRLVGAKQGNVLLRKRQYTLTKEEKYCLSKNQVIAKLRSSVNFLSRFSRNHNINLDKNIDIIKYHIQNIKNNKFDSINALIGYEGTCAKLYFSCFSSMLLNKNFSYEGRTRRPPKNPVDAMLSYLYAILEADITSALNGVGLDPQEGFLHVDKSGRESLSLDIIEEFRSFIVDRLVISMVNRNEIDINLFKYDCLGAITMDEKIRKYIVNAYQKYKQNVITHQYLNEKVQIGLIFHIQAMLYSKYLRGELSNYPPFYFR